MASTSIAKGPGKALRIAASSISSCSRSPSQRLVLSAGSQQRRFNHDLTIKRTTGLPLIQYGPGGRHSVTGHVATVFGCTGFLGRYLVSKLAKKGTQVVIPYRDEDEKRHLKPLGDLGQIVPMEWDMRNDTQVEECVRHSDVVYNLVGRDYETKNFDYSDVHVQGARRIARISALTGVSRLIHVSHLNADPKSPSAVYRAKAEGEEAVKEAFPGATIVKPSWMFGHEDKLLNTAAKFPGLFRFNRADTRIKPVHVLDVAEALAIMLDAESTVGKTFALPGPKSYTFDQILHIVENLTLNKLGGYSVPKWVAIAVLSIWQRAVWWPTMSTDEVKRRYIDDKEPELGTLGFEYLGIEPDVLEDVAITYLRQYRSSSYYDLPIQTGGMKIKQRPYHVVP